MSLNSTSDSSLILIDPHALQEFISKAAFNAASRAYGGPPDLACISVAIKTDKGWNIHLDIRDFYYPPPTSLIVYVTLLFLAEVVLLLVILNYHHWIRKQ